MKKSISEFLNKLEQQSEIDNDLNPKDQSLELVSQEEALMVRGGDKEYKPIYDEESEDEPKWRRSSILLGFLNFS